MDADILRLLNVGLALVAAFLTVAGIVVDWDAVWPKWRPFLVVVAFQQGVIAYASWESFHQRVPAGGRVLLLTLSLATLVAAGLLILQGRHDRADLPG